MALTLKVLGAGAITDNNEKTLVPGTLNKGTLIQTVSLTNTGGTTATISGVFVKPANATRRLISPQNFTIAPNAQFILTSEITLGSTLMPNGFTGTTVLDTLVAQVSSVSPAIDYVVCGMERDV
jgi:hypothetical protein